MKRKQKDRMSRREFLGTSLLGGAALAAKPLAPLIRTGGRKSAARPNILLIITDQQGLDALSAAGCRDLHTPNMDRIKSRGVSFRESYSANPLCSPDRSSLFTGRTSSETGVIDNGLPIRDGIPNLGQWLSDHGYRTLYIGKWHLPRGYQTKIPGFEVLPAGISLRGTVGDASVSRTAEGFLRNYSGGRPFFLVASLLQPHDICGWIGRRSKSLRRIPFAGIEEQLPSLPPNFSASPEEPAKAEIARMASWNELTWRYYLWSYYRMVEEVDREIGRILDALEETGLDRQTLVIFTSDHGEGRGRHRTVLKNFLYEEAAKVPLMFSFPGEIPENRTDTEHLVSALDLVPTVCDYAGVPAPPHQRGFSLRPVLEGKAVSWREFVVSEVMRDQGRMVRTAEFKLIAYRDDPVLQLFDIQKDPWETENLAANPRYVAELSEMKRILTRWERTLKPAPNASGPFVLQ